MLNDNDGYDDNHDDADKYNNNDNDHDDDKDDDDDDDESGGEDDNLFTRSLYARHLPVYHIVSLLVASTLHHRVNQHWLTKI